MKGCFSLIIKTVIAILVFFGLMYLGVIDFIKDKINEHNQSSNEQILDKTKDVIDLSEVGEEYTIDKNLKILNNRMIIAQHNASEQKMIMIEPKNSDILTQEDIKDENIQEKITEILNKYKYKIIKFDRVEVIKHGNMKGIDQTIPYVKIEAEISNLPIKNMEGIVGTAELENGKNLIIIAVNEKGKYSQIITDAFYEKVK